MTEQEAPLANWPMWAKFLLLYVGIIALAVMVVIGAPLGIWALLGPVMLFTAWKNWIIYGYNWDEKPKTFALFAIVTVGMTTMGVLEIIDLIAKAP